MDLVVATSPYAVPPPAFAAPAAAEVPAPLVTLVEAAFEQQPLVGDEPEQQQEEEEQEEEPAEETEEEQQEEEQQQEEQQEEQPQPPAAVFPLIPMPPPAPGRGKGGYGLGYGGGYGKGKGKGFGYGKGKGQGFSWGLGAQHEVVRRRFRRDFSTMNTMSKPAIRRLARRGGVVRMAAGVYDEANGVLRSFVNTIIKDAVIFTEHARRTTVTAMDVVMALKRNGRTLYGF